MARERTPSIEGQRFGRWLVLWDNGDVVEAECDCGRRKVLKRGNLIHGHSTSCGCYRKEKTRQTGLENRGKLKKVKEFTIHDPAKL